jgi:hypothetical protein
MRRHAGDWRFAKLSQVTRSKTIGERAAWDFIERQGGKTGLVVVNPTFVLGPTLTAQVRSSLRLTKATHSQRPGSRGARLAPTQRPAPRSSRDCATWVFWGNDDDEWW